MNNQQLFLLDLHEEKNKHIKPNNLNNKHQQSVMWQSSIVIKITAILKTTANQSHCNNCYLRIIKSTLK